MTNFETLSLIISLLAVVVSAYSLIRTRKIAAKQLKLQQATAELSKKQLEMIYNQEKANEKAFIDLELIDAGDNNQLIICNDSNAEARNINIKLLGEHNPTLRDEFKTKIPIEILKPGKEVSLWAIRELSTPSSYEVEIAWENPDGTIQKDTQKVYE